MRKGGNPFLGARVGTDSANAKVRPIHIAFVEASRKRIWLNFQRIRALFRAAGPGIFKRTSGSVSARVGNAADSAIFDHEIGAHSAGFARCREELGARGRHEHLALAAQEHIVNGASALRIELARDVVE